MNDHAFKAFLASCPGCKTFETVWIRRGVLAPTKKFRQGANRRIYHDCSQLPCQLFCAVYRDGRLRDEQRRFYDAPHRGLGE